MLGSALCGLWLLTLLAPSWALALMPPWVYQQARDTAMYHVQVKVLRVEGPQQTPGECSLTGEVVRIFRDTTGKLTQGSTLVFTVSCRKASDAHVPIGGTLWTDYASLMKAVYIEVFLNSDDNGYKVALWQSHIIEVPTTQAVMK
jgi:hypothetical protein